MASIVVLSLVVVLAVVGEGVAALDAPARYQVSVERLTTKVPCISSQVPAGQQGSSTFNFNYNTAFSVGAAEDPAGLLVRCQNLKDPSHIYDPGPSVIAFTRRVNPNDPLAFAPITKDSVVLEPQGAAEEFGVEDPRLTWSDATGEFLLLYSAVQAQPTVISRLALATTKTPSVKSSWVRQGPIFQTWSKSGSLVLRKRGPHMLIWGDSNLTLAYSYDLRHFFNYPGWFITTRADHFDSALVEAGPSPLPLSDGNLLFLYNSARDGYPSAKPGWSLQYNVGFLILNGSNPMQIFQRSEQPIFSPELDFEKGLPPFLGLTPNVVFVEGWHAVVGARDEFIAYYGAADSTIGAIRIKVAISRSD